MSQTTIVRAVSRLALAENETLICWVPAGTTTEEAHQLREVLQTAGIERVAVLSEVLRLDVVADERLPR